MTSIAHAGPEVATAAETVAAAPPGPAAAPAPGAVLALAEAEAQAFADALHDGALQALVVARYAADAAVRGGDPVVARDAVQDALVALRRAVWMLRPRGEQGLLPALEQLATQLDAAGDAPLHLDVDAPAAVAAQTRLAPAAAGAAYRLVQHAAGRRPLTVAVRCTDSGLRLALDVAVAEPASESLRARAAGGTLLATRDCTSLHLPLAVPPAPSALAFVPAPRDGRLRATDPLHHPLTDEETP